MIGNTTNLTTLSNNDKETFLYIPLRFFFNRYNGLALPLIALQNSSIKITIKFMSDTNCYIKENKYYNGSSFVDFNVNLSLSDASCLLNYIFLDQEEKNRFSQKSHEYLIEQIQFSGEQPITVSQIKKNSFSYNINLNHPVKAIFWILKNNNFTNGTKYLSLNNITKATKRLVLAYTDFSSSISKGSYLTALPNVSAPLQEIIENTFATADIANEEAITLTNGLTLIECELLLTAKQISDISWLTTLGASAIRNTGSTNPGNVAFDVLAYQPDNFALYNDYTGDPIVSAELKLNGHDRFSSQPAKYFTFVQSYEIGKCTPSIGSYMYSFSLYPDKHQPSGTCNFSRIDTTTLELQLNENISDSKVRLYAINYNILKISNGIGIISYAN